MKFFQILLVRKLGSKYRLISKPSELKEIDIMMFLGAFTCKVRDVTTLEILSYSSVNKLLTYKERNNQTQIQ